MKLLMCEGNSQRRRTQWCATAPPLQRQFTSEESDSKRNQRRTDGWNRIRRRAPQRDADHRSSQHRTSAIHLESGRGTQRLYHRRNGPGDCQPCSHAQLGVGHRRGRAVPPVKALQCGSERNQQEKCTCHDLDDALRHCLQHKLHGVYLQRRSGLIALHRAPSTIANSASWNLTPSIPAPSTGRCRHNGLRDNAPVSRPRT